MNLRIIYRSAVIWNVVLHFLLSIMFLFLQKAIYEEKSVLNMAFLKSIVLALWPFIIMLVLGSVLVFSIKKISYYYYIFSVVSISIYSSYQLWLEFSKLIILVLFIYLLVSYYLSYMLKSDLEHAFYNPKYSDNDLFDPMLLKINVYVEDLKSKSSHCGHLTNWDEDGCFIKLEDSIPKKKNLKLRFQFRGHEFVQFATLATLSKKMNGIGVRFIESNAKKSWKDIYKIISDMGVNVEYIQ